MSEHEGDEDQKAKAEKLRAARRRRISENAKRRMDKVLSLQPQEEAKKTVTEENGLVVETGNGGREGIEESCTAGDYLHLTSSPEAAEDPPDELVQLSQQKQPSPIPPSPPAPHPLTPPPLTSRWTAALLDLWRVRLTMSCLSPLLWVAMTSNTLSFFAFFATSELAVILWALVMALMNRGVPNHPQLSGLISVVKVAVGLLYPRAARVVDRLHSLCVLVFSALQDLCVSLFVLVTLASISYFISSPTNHLES